MTTYYDIAVHMKSHAAVNRERIGERLNKEAARQAAAARVGHQGGRAGEPPHQAGEHERALPALPEHHRLPPAVRAAYTPRRGRNSETDPR